MASVNIERRDLIRAISAGAVAGIAGCSGNGGSDEDDGSDEDNGSSQGDKVEIDYLGWSTDADPLYNEWGQLLVEQWEELGVTVNANFAPFLEVLDTIHVQHEGYETGSWGWSGNFERLDPIHFIYQTLHSSQTDEGAYNLVHYENDEYDELAEEQLRLFDREERREPVWECQKIWSEDQPYVPAYGRALLGIINIDRINEDSLQPMVGGLTNPYNYANIEVEGNVLRVGDNGEFGTINPLGASQALDRRWIMFAWDRLAMIDARDEVKAVPWAAEEIIQDDETTFTLPLHDDMVFTDGESVTTEDVVFSYRFQEEHAPSIASFIEPIDEIEQVDEYTVRFHLSEAFAPFEMQSLVMPSILPKHIWENLPDDVDDPSQWIDTDRMTTTSGLFKITGFTRSEETELVAHKDHHKFTPNIDEMTRTVGTPQSVLRLVEDEQIDLYDPIPMSSPQRVENLDNDYDHLSKVPGNTHGISTLVFHNKTKPLNDQAMRRALTYTLPKQQIVDLIYNGYGQVAQSIMKEESFPFWHNPNVDKFTLDQEAARAELEDAGYTWDDNDDLRYPDSM